MTEKFIRVDTEALYRSIDALKRDNPELELDDQLLRDMVDGETSFTEIMDRLLSIHLRAQEGVVGAKERKKALEERISRQESVSDWAKSQMLSLMKQTGNKSLPLIEATITLNAAKKRVEIEDIDSLGQGFYTTEKVAKKKEIGDALKAGADVPGAKLVDGVESLTVRTK